MTTNYKLQTTNYRRGAALIMAVLMSSVMLSVGLGVYQRTYKALYFASFWKQTQIAFAAADSGLECALYWDLHQPVTDYTCFGNPPAIWPTTFPETLDMTTPSGCANVTITKPSPNDNPYTNPIVKYSTLIESRGYNDCNTSNPRRVERALRIDY